MVDWKKYGEPFSEEFTERIQAEWKERGFNKDQCKKWLKVGLQPSDADYAKWLRDIEQDTLEDFQKYGDGEFLKEQYQKYSLLEQEIKLTWTLPLERFSIIRGNIRHFQKKWGKEVEVDRYEKIFDYSKKTQSSGSKVTEISKLHSPKELWRFHYTLLAVRFFSNGSTMAASILLSNPNTTSVGGGILAIYPFSELLFSKLEVKLKDKEDKWKEFVFDTEKFLDNYNELFGIIDQFKVEKLKEGMIKRILRDLDKKTKDFLGIYDENNDKLIDVDELLSRRGYLTENLGKGKESEIQGFINAIKNLENVIIDYRLERILDWEKVTEKENTTQLLTNSEDKNSTDLRKRVGHASNDSNSDLVDIQGQEGQQVKLEMELEEIKTEELQTQIEISPKK